MSVDIEGTPTVTQQASERIIANLAEATRAVTEMTAAGHVPDYVMVCPRRKPEVNMDRLTFTAMFSGQPVKQLQTDNYRKFFAERDGVLYVACDWTAGRTSHRDVETEVVL